MVYTIYTHTVVRHELEVTGEAGLHARPAALFARLASRYDSEVRIEKDGTAAPAAVRAS